MTSPITGTLFVNPKQQPLSNNGTTQSGMLGYFYISGTLTPTPVYSDAGLTSPISQPVTADASGTFQAIYLNPAVLTRAILQTSTGIQLSDTDPINANGGSISSGAISFSPDGGSAIAAFRGGSFVTGTQPGGLIMGTAGSPLVNGGVNSAQFCVEVVTDGTSAPGTGVQCFIGRNVSTNAAAINYCFEAGNDVVGNELIMGTTSSAYSGSVFTAGPTGEQKFLGTPANKPIVVGINSKAIAVFQDTKITGLGPVAAAQVDMTPDTGTFTVTYTGFTGSVTGTAKWVRNGNQVTLFFPAAGGTSNANTFGATGLPASIQPATQQRCAVSQYNFEDNTTVGGFDGAVAMGTGSSIGFTKNGSLTGWTNSGTKGVTTGGFTISYLLV